MFLKHQKLMSQENVLINSIMITVMIMILDYVLISDQPSFLGDNSENFYFDENDHYDEVPECEDNNVISDEEIKQAIEEYDFRESEKHDY